MVTVEELREALKAVEDPEIGMNIIDLGLVYQTEIQNGHVDVQMTLTTPFCPLGSYLTGQVQAVLSTLPGVEDVTVDLVWNPPWDPRTMASEEAKDMLGIW
ncbi:MAG: metal-sulfur cluster assembly factor [Chloroflexi bacterium]|nr:metal-sulfur cluster assembly factor [Chloroflexota bacterium]